MSFAAFKVGLIKSYKNMMKLKLEDYFAQNTKADLTSLLKNSGLNKLVVFTTLRFILLKLYVTLY